MFAAAAAALVLAGPPTFAVAADRASVTYGPTDRDAPLTVSFRGRPLDGETKRDGHYLRFTPRFRLVAGQQYAATFGDRTAALTAPADPPPATPTRVDRVSGLRDTVPENTLRLYLHFSRPMTRGEGLTHVRLTGADGEEVVEPFLDLAEELWNPAGDRLTLLFDPGRVKRDLAPREVLGPILEAGNRYTLAVDAKWPDAAGFPLGKPFAQTFTAGPADRTPIDPAKWAVVWRAGGVGTVLLDGWLDEALARQCVAVHDVRGEPVAGLVVTPYPHHPALLLHAPNLTEGRYKLVVDPRLEDPCGNRVGRAFEIEPAAPAAPVKPVEVPFTVLAAWPKPPE